MNLSKSVTISRHKEIHQQFVDMGKVTANFKLKLHHKKNFYKLLNRWQSIGKIILIDPGPSQEMRWHDKEEYQKRKGDVTSLTTHKKKERIKPFFMRSPVSA